MDIRKCYELLDLRPGYSQEDLKQAYKDLVQVWHPDRFTHNQRLQEKAESKLKQINKAYEVLEQALVARNRAQAARARIYAPDPNQTHEDQTARAVYEQTAAWQPRRHGSTLRLQVSMLLWSFGVFLGSILLIVILAALSRHVWMLIALLLIVGGYFGLRWLGERGWY